MSYLNQEELRLGQELYQTTGRWKPSGYEYQARTIVHTGSNGDAPTAAPGANSKPPARSHKAVKGALRNTVVKKKA